MLPAGLFILGPESISLLAKGGFGWSNRWIEVDKCKKCNGMLSSDPAFYFRTHKACRRCDGLPCPFGFLSFLLSLILFNFLSILHLRLLAFCLVDPSKSTPHLLVIRQVVELKSELKRQGLAVSGPKNELIERLKCCQELKTASRNTSCPTAGGARRSGAERAAVTAADSGPAGAPHHFLHYQTFLNLQPGDGNNPVFECKIKEAVHSLGNIQIYEHFFISPPAAVAQPLALLGSDVLPPPGSFSTSSPCSRNPEGTSMNILEDVV